MQMVAMAASDAIVLKSVFLILAHLVSSLTCFNCHSMQILRDKQTKAALRGDSKHRLQLDMHSNDIKLDVGIK